MAADSSQCSKRGGHAVCPVSVPRDIAGLLIAEAERINSVDFIADDPVQFPRRYDDLRDIEITAFLTAIISWGRRSMILRDADRMLALMDHQPYLYLKDKGYEDLDPSLNIHRTFFGRDLLWMMRTLNKIYTHHESLADFADAHRVGESETPSWQLAGLLGRLGHDANSGIDCPQCVPTNLRTTALKRINMALRWLVRKDGIVDLGVWDCVPESKLYLPLDIHVGNTARALGLLLRNANDRRSTEELTKLMRTLRPEDPCLFDYALFGIGVEGKTVF